jgi:hypothetical protein
MGQLHRFGWVHGALFAEAVEADAQLFEVGVSAVKGADTGFTLDDDDQSLFLFQGMNAKGFN